MSASAYDRPKPERQPCPPYKVLPRNSKKTLKEFLTNDETQFHLLKLLIQFSVRPKGPWAEYYKFYLSNATGDMPTFKPESKRYVEKMKKDLEREYAKLQTEGDEPGEENVTVSK